VPVRLDARSPRIPDGPWRSEAEGSHLVWDQETCALTYSPPARRPGSGWAVQVGPGPQQAAGMVRVRGSLPQGRAGFVVGRFEVDHFVVVSNDDSVLTTGVATGASDAFAGWYPPAAVRELADASGLTYAEDTVVDWADLLDRYPGLVQGARSLARIATINALLYGALGVLALASGLAGVVLALTGDRTGMLLAALALPPGALFLWIGLSHSYRFTRLRTRRGQDHGAAHR
jgi:hypothetical protein